MKNYKPLPYDTRIPYTPLQRQLRYGPPKKKFPLAMWIIIGIIGTLLFIGGGVAYYSLLQSYEKSAKTKVQKKVATEAEQKKAFKVYMYSLCAQKLLANYENSKTWVVPDVKELDKVKYIKTGAALTVAGGVKTHRGVRVFMCVWKFENKSLVWVGSLVVHPLLLNSAILEFWKKHQLPTETPHYI